MRRLQEDAPLPEIALATLSGLEGEPLHQFRRAWIELDTDRRVRLVWILTEAAADNVVLDFAAVCEVAMNDPEPVVREQAYRLAGEDAGSSLFEPTLRAAADEPDHEARTAAIDTLGVFTLQAQADDWPEAAQQAAQRVLLDQLHSPEADLTLRQAALLSISYLTTPESETEIRQAYAQPDMRQTAIEAMGRNCQDIWLPDLRTELRSKQPAYRLQAILACIEREDERLVPDLVDRIGDPEREVRLAAIQALGAIGGRDAELALDEIERSSDPAFRRAAAQALGEARGRDEFFSIPRGLSGRDDLTGGEDDGVEDGEDDPEGL
ncbi:MAG: HEAT repeat domain-containing protein [Chloroflexi bacterium]|nr:HEAT repeat domain-containing protein [Chloroflexota bacterium]